jgi:hypothetical protein
VDVVSDSKLSAVWFPDNQRATATAIAYTANALGTSIGFLIVRSFPLSLSLCVCVLLNNWAAILLLQGPGIAPTPDKLPTLLYVQIGMAALPIIGGIIYYRYHTLLRHCRSCAVILAVSGRTHKSGAPSPVTHLSGSGPSTHRARWRWPTSKGATSRASSRG